MSADEKIVWMAREHMRDLPEAVVPAGYRIRPYRTAETDVWTRIVREAGVGPENGHRTFEEAFPGDEAVRTRRILFAEDMEGHPVGTVGAWHGKDGPEGGGWGTVERLAVLPSHRKRGVGRALLSRALKEQSAVHAHTGSFLEATSSQHDAIRLYVDAGFLPWMGDKNDRQNWKDIAKALACPRLDEIISPPPVPPAPDAVVAGLKAMAIPLAGCEAGRGFDDLRAFKKVIGDARIVSMGEATHGTREFFQLKHRLLEFLVIEMGFTAFAIEASFPECLMLDRYVTTGEGDPLDGITNMRFWTWNTEEVLEMVRWMRRHNERAARPVRFYGFDMQFPSLAVREMIRNLRTHAPKQAVALEARLRPFADDFGERAFHCLPENRKLALVQAVQEAGEAIRNAEWPDARAYTLGCLNAKVAFQSADCLIHGYSSAIRDRAMAENARALLDLEGPDGRIALWAHNGHVAKSGGEGMGQHLDKWFGDKQVVIGFAFGNGWFQASDMQGSGLKDFKAPAPPEGSLDETLLRNGLPILALDLSGIPPESETGRWLGETHVTRSTGAGFSDDPDDTPWFGDRNRIGELYDVLLFVANTTAARPNPDWRRIPQEDTPPPAPAANLDYASSMEGGLPKAWKTWRRERRTEYDIIVEGGTACLRQEGAPWEWGVGGVGHLSKSFNAAPYRGRRIRLTAEGRIAAPTEWDRAYLVINAHKGDRRWVFDASEGVVFAATTDEPWTQDGWEARSLEIEVPASADTITFAFALAGNGSAWIRSIRLETVGEGAG